MAIAARDFRELRLDGMSRNFGTVNALKGVTLNVRRGEFIALLGPSGCGKSTALNCLAGLLTLSSGSIWLDQTRIDRLQPEDRGFGMVFQNYALFPHMSVRKNIGFGLAMQGLPKPEIKRKVDEALSIVRLGDQGDKLPGQLSGGQQQRVAIARAIVIEPPLVLMDEPLSNLDAKLRLEMRAEIRRIHDLIGSATIYVTHDQEEALSLADRIVVMRVRRGAPGRHAGRSLHPPGACRRRRVHGLSQSNPLARGEIRQPVQHQRRRRQPARHAGRDHRRRRRGGGGQARRPQGHRRRAALGDGGVGAISRP